MSGSVRAMLIGTFDGSVRLTCEDDVEAVVERVDTLALLDTVLHALWIEGNASKLDEAARKCIAQLGPDRLRAPGGGS